MLERNVTRAAVTLGMSQPAVSNALLRARRMTKDDLFIKVADGVRPTARMLAMWPELHRSLSALRAVVAPQEFDARSSSAIFRVAITDSIAAEAVTQIALRVRKLAPQARVTFSVHTNASSTEGVERGTLDCAVGMFPALPHSLHVQGLLTDRYVCVMRKRHPLARRMTLDEFVNAAHLLVTPSGQELGVVDGWLSLQQRSRNVVMVVNHFVDALRIVEHSDLLTCVPSQFLRSTQAAKALSICELPFETEKILYKLVWHERVHGHPAHLWFRSIVASVCDAAEVGKPAVRKQLQ